MADPTTLTPQQLQFQMNHLHDSQRPAIVSSAIIMITVTTLAVWFRLAIRKYKKIPFWWDDWLCLIAWPFAILGAVLALANQSLGHHIWSLTPSEILEYCNF